MSHLERKEAAIETIDILRKGSYTINGEKVSIAKEQKKSVESSIFISEKEGASLLEEVRDNHYETIFTCINESTVTAIHRLYQADCVPLGVLNFASAKNPGGGFRSGAIAQEESLAISSGLYYTLTRNKILYDQNKANASIYYTNNAIFSPDVPFFRDENLSLMTTPSLVSVFTLPAVNRKLVGNQPDKVKKAEQLMRYRMRLCLATFSHYGIEHIILGAYGCGVFKNAPNDVAFWWKELLEYEYKGQFQTVHYAVLDSSKKQNCFQAFHESVANN